MADNRTQRELQTRDKETRALHEYVPPSTLPDPLPQPGYKFRWIMTHLLGQPQLTNVATRVREGWVPVKAVDHPELNLPAGKDGNVEVGGLMLCKAPVEFVEARNAYYAKQNRAQVESVDNHFMRNNDPRMPLFKEGRSETSFGRGAK
jgi:hypothetical protein